MPTVGVIAIDRPQAQMEQCTHCDNLVRLKYCQKHQVAYSTGHKPGCPTLTGSNSLDHSTCNLYHNSY